MRVLQLTSHFSPNIGGVETHLDNLVNILIKKKYDVFVLTYRPLTTKTKWSIYEKNNHLKIFRLPWFPGLFYQLTQKPLLEFLYLLPGLFLATPFVLMKENLEVIHAHGLIAGFVGVFWGKLFKKRVIISLHSIYHFPKVGLYTNFVTWIFTHSDKLLCLSKQSAKEVTMLGVAKEKIIVFTYWIDIQHFRPIPQARNFLHMKSMKSVLFVGRLVEEKGIKVLLESAKMWDKKIHLFVIGAGPLDEYIKKATKQSNIHFLGKISQMRLPFYYCAADVLIVPSVHDEGFGRVILEALACGTPIIASDKPGIHEAVSRNVAVFIQINVKNITNTVESFFKKDEGRIIKEKTREYAKKRFSGANADIILQCYE